MVSDAPDHEKCTRLSALSVGKSAKFRSSPQKAGQFIVMSALRKEGDSRFLESPLFIFLFKSQILKTFFSFFSYAKRWLSHLKQVLF